jgi:hypothetical protein
MPIKTININLLPREDVDQRSLNKFLKWALTYGRYIVVITELVVILAFLSRFKLDRDKTDLDEKISQKQAIVEATSDLEKEIRSLQNRLSAVRAFSSFTVSQKNILESFSLTTPPEVAIDNFTISGRKVEVRGLSLSETGLASMINGLITSGKWGEISLNDLDRSKKRPGLLFSLSAVYRAKE